jgi:hypothetical protein
MASDSKNIGIRTFKGSSVPTGSKMGKVLINSSDSRKVVNAIRTSVKSSKSSTVSLSRETVRAIKKARG